MKENFKNAARNKQARYFMENYGIKEFDTVKRRVRGHDVAKEIKVDALLKWDDAKDGIIFYDGYRRQILPEFGIMKCIVFINNNRSIIWKIARYFVTL